MAVNNRKSLHKHAVPIILVGIGLFIVSTVSLSHLLQSTVNVDSSLSHILTARLLDIKPSANGLARITVHQPASDALPAVANPANLGQVSSTGQVTALDALLTDLDQSTKP